MSLKKYSFVTVYFEAEMPLLELQARSFQLYVSSGLIEEIVLIDNSAPGAGRPHSELGALYGRLGHLVKVFTAESLSRLPPASGWDTQQILKLMASQVVSAPRYVVLDTKTHFISTLTGPFLAAEDGRAHANLVSYEKNPQLYALRRALRFFDVEQKRWPETIKRSLDSITPFVFYTDVVRRMIRDLEQTYRRPFATLFVEEGFSEFTLYSVWLSDVLPARSIETFYKSHSSYPGIIWGNSWELDKVSREIRQAKSSGNPTFSTHRRAFIGLTKEAANELSVFWISRNLMRTEEQASALMRQQKSLVDDEVAKSRKASIIYRVLVLSRRIQSRLRIELSRAKRKLTRGFA